MTTVIKFTVQSTIRHICQMSCISNCLMLLDVNVLQLYVYRSCKRLPYDLLRMGHRNLYCYTYNRYIIIVNFIFISVHQFYLNCKFLFRYIVTSICIADTFLLATT